MNHFKYEKVDAHEVLHCEGVSLEHLAKEVGTPFYCYSQATLTRHFRVFNEAFADIPHIICFSVKANSNVGVLNLFAEKGSGFDIVSGGELERVMAAGGDPRKVVFSGVGKTRAEMRQAMEVGKDGILLFNVESEPEIYVLNEVAAELGRKVPIAIRVNPDIDPKTHPYISTGLRKAKFGIDIGMAKELFAKAKGLKNLDPIGVDCHIGSQLTEINPFVDTLKSLMTLVEDLRKDGLKIRYLDIGGGLGITYKSENPPHPKDYADVIVPLIKKLDVTLLLEPGRVIVGNAGVLVSRVLYVKKTGKKNFVIADAGMNDLIRPALYQAHQEIQPVTKNQKGEMQADVVGPICETGDFLALDRQVPEFKANDLLAVMSAGAYGFSMSSTYNTRPRVAEVLVNQNTFHVIRARETVTTLLRGEHIPVRGTDKIKNTFRLPFAKMHGNGNDFIVIDARNLRHESFSWREVSKKICDRRFGIGADQVLLLWPNSREDVDATMAIYDADGSEVEMCGNGLRALALYLRQEKICQKETISVALPERVVSVRRLSSERFEVDMGEPILDGRKIPVQKDGQVLNHALTVDGKEFLVTCVSMGNPHAVIEINESVEKYPVTTYGPQLETHAFFPKRANIEFVERLSKNQVRSRIWERGTGETLACGSGACAIVVAGVLTGKGSRKIDCLVPGGTLSLEWRESNNHVYLTGEARRVFDGDIDLKVLTESNS